MWCKGNTGVFGTSITCSNHVNAVMEGVMVTAEQYKKYQMSRYFLYVRNHIALVNEIGAKTFKESYERHDFDKLLESRVFEDKYYITYAKRNLTLDGEYTPTDLEKEDSRYAVAQHVKHNPHHPEFWDKSITLESFTVEPPSPVDCSLIPDEYIKEMCCDWSAVAIKKNSPILAFYKGNVGADKRFKFTETQSVLIEKYLNQILEAVEKFKIQYPNVPYTAKN